MKESIFTLNIVFIYLSIYLFFHKDIYILLHCNEQSLPFIYAGLLIFRAVAEPRNSQKLAKYREIR